jgi:hypothetical protein
MTDEQISELWAFSRGDTDPKAFEQWLFEQSELEEALGETHFLQLVSANYHNKDEVRDIRLALAAKIDGRRQCECPKIASIVAIPMGGDWYFERVFEPLEQVAVYGPDKWWLYISRCKQCRTNWLIAQDERIYDDFFMRRITDGQVANAKVNKWPTDFITYEKVLLIGLEKSNPPRFLDPMAGSLIWTVEDLLLERPEITVHEIAKLLGITDEHAAALALKASTGSIQN